MSTEASEYNPHRNRLLETYPHENWMDTAICRSLDSSLFFPEDGQRSAEAKLVCSTCIHQSACLEYAVQHGIRDGVWGGVAERDRRKMIAARRRLSVAAV